MSPKRQIGYYLKVGWLKITFLFVIQISSVHPNCTAQSWLWARTAYFVGANECLAYATAADISGNVYVTGYFENPSVTFGSTTLYADGTDMFLVKYDSSGNVIWAKCAGGRLVNDYGYSVSTDVSGNVYVSGNFGEATTTFDTITLTNGGGGQNIFLVKYDASGNVLWAKSASGTGDDFPYATTTDNAGNVYLTGYFTSPTLTIDTVTVNSMDRTDATMLLAKFDSSGNALWAKAAGNGLNNVVGTSVAVDAADNVYVSGTNSGANNGYPVVFGSYVCNDGIFLVKYDANSNVIWATSEGTNIDNVISISSDPSNNIYFAGVFEDTTITFGSITLTNYSSGGMFLVKYDSAGNAIWARTDNQASIAYSVTADAMGSVYLLGFLGNDTLLEKYNYTGSLEWAKSVNDSNCFPNSVTVDNNGNVYISGFFNVSTLSFGSAELVNTDTPYYDMFLAKLSSTEGVPVINPNQKNIIIYPNPATTRLTIQTDGTTYTAYTITNTIGVTLLQQNIDSPVTYVDIKSLPAGMYYVTLMGADGNTVVRKVVKE